MSAAYGQMSAATGTVRGPQARSRAPGGM